MEINGIEPLFYACKAHTLPLSYIPFMRVMGFEPITSAWKAENLPLIYTRAIFFILKVY